MESAEKRAQAATNILRLMVNCKCPKCKPSSRSEHSFQVIKQFGYSNFEKMCKLINKSKYVHANFNFSNCQKSTMKNQGSFEISKLINLEMYNVVCFYTK